MCAAWRKVAEDPLFTWYPVLEIMLVEVPPMPGFICDSSIGLLLCSGRWQSGPDDLELPHEERYDPGSNVCLIVLLESDVEVSDQPVVSWKSLTTVPTGWQGRYPQPDVQVPLTRCSPALSASPTTLPHTPTPHHTSPHRTSQSHVLCTHLTLFCCS